MFNKKKNVYLKMFEKCFLCLDIMFFSSYAICFLMCSSGDARGGGD